MPDNTSPSGQRFTTAPTLQVVAAMCRTHDADGLAAIEAYLASRPINSTTLPLARMLADYADQRGWRDRAAARYHELLRGTNDSAAVATLHYDLAEHAHRWTDLAAMTEHLDAAEQAAFEDWTLTARGLRLRALLHCDRHQPTLGYDKARQAVALAAEHDDWPAEAIALVILSYAHIHLGQFTEAAACTERVVRADPATTGDKWYAIAVSDHGYALRRVEGNTAALPWYERALALQSERRDPIELRAASANVAEVYRPLGRLDDAEAVVRHGIAVLEAIDAPQQAGILFNNLGNVQANRGDHAAAIASYEQALRYARQLKKFDHQITSCANLGESCFALGDLPAAIAWWLTSGVLAYRMGQTTELGHRVRRLRKVLADTTADQKRAAYEQALRLGAEFGWQPIDVRALAQQVGLVLEVAVETEPPVPTPQDHVLATEELGHAVDQLIHTVEDPQSMPDKLQAGVQRVWQAAQGLDSAALVWPVQRLAPLIAVPHAGRAAYVALCWGGLVEQGADSASALPVLLDRLALVLADCEAYASACRDAAGGAANDLVEAIEQAGATVAQERPELARAWWALELFGRAGAALLSRTSAGRRAARANERLIGPIGRLADVHEWSGWLNELLGVLDDEELLVLHPALGRGYRVRISGIADNFQLHTLLADALIGDPDAGWLPGRRPDAAVVAAARGLSGEQTAETAQGVFNMVGWRGLGADASLAEGVGDSAHWIWGEGVPSDIEPFEGVRVVLLGPPPYARSWNAERRFSGLVAAVQVVEHLTPEAARSWLDRIARASH